MAQDTQAFKCPICNTPFVYSGHFNAHLRTHRITLADAQGMRQRGRTGSRLSCVRFQPYAVGAMMTSPTLFDWLPVKDATFSPCERYRYTLRRQWDASKPYVLFVMLNPSTADATQNDPTIRRCIGFAKSVGLRRIAGGQHLRPAVYRSPSPCTSCV